MTPEPDNDVMEFLKLAKTAHEEHARTLQRIVHAVESTDRDKPGLAMRVDRMERAVILARWAIFTGLGTGLAIVYQLQQLLSAWKAKP